MDVETLKSYLVSLGFKVDQPQLSKFDNALREAANSVTLHTSGIVKDILKWQIAITGAFTGVSTGILAMAEHVAMADQKYRLLGLRMFMTTENARTLSMAMDILGVSMDEIGWDPEINRNFLQLADLSEKMTKNLGPTFEANMQGIRDIIQKFNLLRMAGEFVANGTISKLFEAMGTSVDGVNAKLQEWIDYLSDKDKFNAFTTWLAGEFKDVLLKTWDILVEVGDALRAALVLFQNIVGFLSGDKTLAGTAVTFDTIGAAVKDVTKLLEGFVVNVTKAETGILHLANAALLLHDKPAEASKEVAAALPAGARSAVIKGGGALQGIKQHVDALKGFFDYNGSIFGMTGLSGPEGAIVQMLAAVATMAYGARQGWGAASKELGPDAPIGSNTPSDIASRAREIAIDAGKQLGTDPKLIFEQMAFETGNFTNRGARDLHNLAGINVPGGKGEDYRDFKSWDDFKDYYAKLLKNHYPAVQGATSEQQFADAASGWWDLSKRTTGQYAAGMQTYGGEWDQMNGGGITLAGDINVNITGTGLSKEELAEAMTTELGHRIKKQAQQTQRTTAQIGQGN